VADLYRESAILRESLRAEQSGTPLERLRAWTWEPHLTSHAKAIWRCRYCRSKFPRHADTCAIEQVAIQAEAGDRA
jgi:hypothetical protein